MKVTCCLTVAMAWLVAVFSVHAAEEIVCQTTESQIVQYLPANGQVGAIVIYACGPDAGTINLPAWYAAICDNSPSQPLSIPNYFEDMSFGNHILNMTPFGRNSTECFVSDFNYGLPGGGLPNDPAPQAFWNNILDKADDVINFANFDNYGPDGTPNSGDDDGFVDILFFAVVNHGGGRGIAAGYNYTTDADRAGGGKMSFSRNQTV
ncbi:MAG: hypothetical protein ACREOO_06875 [bacterium]